jgi:hypothetical protein
VVDDDHRVGGVPKVAYSAQRTSGPPHSAIM